MQPLRGAWQWFDDRTGIGKLVGPIARHPVPPGSASRKTGWMYIFGTATLFAFILQVVTGTALALEYVPSAAHAYESLTFITNDITLGKILRGAHFFGASAMVVFIGIHMARVYLTGSYKYPREVNWLSGTVLLGLTILMAFTGQLLRWDQDGVWSVVIAAEQAGRVPAVGHALAHFILAGETVGAATLSRFFAFHVFFIPGLIFATLGFHLYLVLHNGISEPPRSGAPVEPQRYRAWYRDMLRREGRPYWPDSAWHEIVFGFLLVIGVMTLALVLGPPRLGKPPDPANLIAQPRPDWYLLWYYAVLALLQPAIEDWFIVLAPLIFFAALILLPFLARRGERSLRKRPWALGFVFAAVAVILTFSIEGELAPWSPHFDAKPVPAEVVGTTTGQVAQGAVFFHDKGCEYCHAIAGEGGIRGPDMTHIADRLSPADMKSFIANGIGNMPAYARILTPAEMDALVAFLSTRSTTSSQSNPASASH